MGHVSHAQGSSFVVNDKYFVVRKFIRQDALISLYSLTGCARAKQILIVDLLDKQDATAISINIDHYCLRISGVMHHIA